MRTIWKFPLDVPDTQIEIAPGFRVVAVGMQSIGNYPESAGRAPCIWIEHDPTAELWTQRFEVYATGAAIPDGRRWVGTFFDDPFVWHVYHDPLGSDGSES